MIRIEKPEFKGQCNCCFNWDDVKQIQFITNLCNGSVISLCWKCRIELYEELKKHCNPPTVQGREITCPNCPECGAPVAKFFKHCPDCGKELWK